MALKERLRKLERQVEQQHEALPEGGVPPFHVNVYFEELKQIDCWLREQGLTAEQALARGLEGPPGLRYASLATVAEAHRQLDEWERSRFPEEGNQAEGPVPPSTEARDGSTPATLDPGRPPVLP
jgi:hypothetical protein